MMENARNTHTHRTPYPLVATNVCVRSRVCVRMKKKGRERALDVDGLQMQTNDGRMTIPVIVRPQPPHLHHHPPSLWQYISESVYWSACYPSKDSGKRGSPERHICLGGQKEVEIVSQAAALKKKKN